MMLDDGSMHITAVPHFCILRSSVCTTMSGRVVSEENKSSSALVRANASRSGKDALDSLFFVAIHLAGKRGAGGLSSQIEEN